MKRDIFIDWIAIFYAYFNLYFSYYWIFILYNLNGVIELEIYYILEIFAWVLMSLMIDINYLLVSIYIFDSLAVDSYELW